MDLKNKQKSVLAVPIQETKRSAIYMKIDYIRDELSEEVSKYTGDSEKVYPGTMNITVAGDGNLFVNRIVRKHGTYFKKSEKSLPYWIHPGILQLLDDQDQIIKEEIVGVLYPLAKSDNKSIEVISKIFFQKDWKLEYGKTKLVLKIRDDKQNPRKD